MGNIWVKSIREIKCRQFTNAYFNYGQLETGIITAGLYKITPLKFWYIYNVWVKVNSMRFIQIWMISESFG